MAARQREVVSTDGVRLAVYESGATDAPTIVLVHGWPDNHTLWDDVVVDLSRDFHVVTSDVRGAGASDKPAGRNAYRIPQLTDDLLAVLDATSPYESVHLVGHDWGSIQAWPALTDKRVTPRIATFTSLSGPSLDHSARWMRQVHRHPRGTLRQFAHSYYILLFQLPRLPELLARRGVLTRGAHRAGRPTGDAVQGATDAAYGVQLYRANMLHRLSVPRPEPIDLPVQLVVAEQDIPVTADLVVGATRPWVADLTVMRIPGGHWTVSEQPELIARCIRDFAAQTPTATSSAARSSSR